MNKSPIVCLPLNTPLCACLHHAHVMKAEMSSAFHTQCVSLSVFLRIKSTQWSIEIDSCNFISQTKIIKLKVLQWMVVIPGFRCLNNLLCPSVGVCSCGNQNGIHSTQQITWKLFMVSFVLLLHVADQLLITPAFCQWALVAPIQLYVSWL